MKLAAVFILMISIQSAHAQEKDVRDCRAEGRQAYQEALEGDPSCQDDKNAKDCLEAAAAARNEAVRACNYNR